MAEAFARSRIARDVLALLMDSPGQELHSREIARRVDADAHPVQRALEKLMVSGLVVSRRLGNLRLWAIDAESDVVPAARDVIRRTAGLSARLRDALAAVPGVVLAFIFGSYASGTDSIHSDVDLFVVGEPRWSRLSGALQSEQDQVAREINLVLWTVDELQRPSARQRRFLEGLLAKPHLWLQGDDRELERFRASVAQRVVKGARASERAARHSRRAHTAGARRTEPRT